jgi:hypothetical protein
MLPAIHITAFLPDGKIMLDEVIQATADSSKEEWTTFAQRMEYEAGCVCYLSWKGK